MAKYPTARSSLGVASHTTTTQLGTQNAPKTKRPPNMAGVPKTGLGLAQRGLGRLSSTLFANPEFKEQERNKRLGNFNFDPSIAGRGLDILGQEIGLTNTATPTLQETLNPSAPSSLPTLTAPLAASDQSANTPRLPIQQQLESAAIRGLYNSFVPPESSEVLNNLKAINQGMSEGRAPAGPFSTDTEQRVSEALAGIYDPEARRAAGQASLSAMLEARRAKGAAARSGRPGWNPAYRNMSNPLPMGIPEENRMTEDERRRDIALMQQFGGGATLGNQPSLRDELLMGGSGPQRFYSRAQAQPELGTGFDREKFEAARTGRAGNRGVAQESINQTKFSDMMDRKNRLANRFAGPNPLNAAMMRNPQLALQWMQMQSQNQLAQQGMANDFNLGMMGHNVNLYGHVMGQQMSPRERMEMIGSFTAGENPMTLDEATRAVDSLLASGQPGTVGVGGIPGASASPGTMPTVGAPSWTPGQPIPSVLLKSDVDLQKRARDLGYTEEQILQMLRQRTPRASVSMDRPYGTTFGSALADTLGPSGLIPGRTMRSWGEWWRND